MVNPLEKKTGGAAPATAAAVKPEPNGNGVPKFPQENRVPANTLPVTLPRPTQLRTSIAVVKELADVLNVGLTQEQLRICVELLEAGICPRLLGEFVKKCRDRK